MPKLYSAIKICMILSVCVTAKTEGTDKNGGYSALVSFSQNVKYDDGKRLVESFQETLENSSVILYDAIGRPFTRVIFKIPSSWDISEWNVTTDDSTIGMNAKSDFLIDGSNDVVFGKFPFAQQYGSCGTAGHQIVIPTEFLSDANEFPPGLALAREWLKYRYGVFDENGFIGDPLYPAYYIQPGSDAKEVKITECTNSPIVYNFTDEAAEDCEADDSFAKRLDSGECSAVPVQESLENVTSSLMYYHKDIASMQHICGREDIHPHNAMSPNKHNAMCRGQSVWDIIGSSRDFKDVPSIESYEEIEYFYVQESLPRVIVAWENTANISSAKMGGVILNSIKRFIYDLPDESQFCGFPFSNILSEDKDYSLRTLSTMKEKNDVMPNILSDFIRDTYGDVNLAVSKALDILSSDESNSQQEGTIIIMTMSNVHPDASVLERLQRHPKVCVVLLYLGGDTVPEDIGSFVNSCGSSKSLKTDDEEKVIFSELFSTMESVLPETVDDKKTETVTTGYLTKDSSIVFETDETVETLTFWVFTDKESENFELKFNQVNQKFTKMKTTAVMALTFSPSEAGSVEFLYPYDTTPLFTQVRSISRAGMYMKGHVLTHDTSENSSDIQMPVIIYAMIRFGSYPVQNAAVSATIKTPEDEVITFELFDDGRGDPDITQDDGVYSRYFTQFTGKGEYTVTVTVKTQDLSSYGKDENAGYQTCCGSFVKAVQSKLPKVTKLFHTSFQAKNGRPEEGYKPARVLDLRIDSATDDKIVLKWSAPGGEGDTGTVESYEIKFFNALEDAIKDQNGIILNNTITPTVRGEVQTLELPFGDFEGTGWCYLTITSKNSKQISDSSNILNVYIPDTGTTTSDKDIDETNNVKAGSSKNTALIVGLIVLVIILVICVCLAVYFLVVRRKPPDQMQDNPVYDSTESVRRKNERNGLNPINFIPADVILSHHNEKTRAKMQNKEPPIFKEEDFDGSNTSFNTEPKVDDTAQSSGSANGTAHNADSLPPKSPKKTTYV